MANGKSGPIGTVTGSSLVIRESMTMALYITISLLAVLAAQPPGDRSVIGVLGIIWGTTLRLSLAHWLAFRLTARLFSGADLDRHDQVTMAARGVAAIGVATLRRHRCWWRTASSRWTCLGCCSRAWWACSRPALPAGMVQDVGAQWCTPSPS